MAPFYLMGYEKRPHDDDDDGRARKQREPRWRYCDRTIHADLRKVIPRQYFLNRSMSWPNPFILDMDELRMGYCDLRSRLSELPLNVLYYEIQKYFVCHDIEAPLPPQNKK